MYLSPPLLRVLHITRVFHVSRTYLTVQCDAMRVLVVVLATGIDRVANYHTCELPCRQTFVLEKDINAHQVPPIP